MPIIPSTFQAKGLFKNPHFSTIFSAKLRKVNGVHQKRERIHLEDGDFVDIDWSFSKSTVKTSKTCLLVHGLEGNAQRSYMLGQARILNQNGYACAALNLRGCSGEENKMYHSYHSGATEDLAEIIALLVKRYPSSSFYLWGVSLGGNIILKYLGEQRDRPAQLAAAVAISTPVRLHGSLEQLVKKQNWVYRWSFLRNLRKKYRRKMAVHPEKMNLETLKKIKSLNLFDELYTAPAHGFTNALEYYAKSSSLPFLPTINIPTLLLNAQNDSFLDAACYPKKEAKDNPNLYLEIPEYGGHVGFYAPKGIYYSEQRSLDFFENHTATN